MFLPNALELFPQCIVIGLVIILLALRDLVCRRRLPVEVDGVAIESRQRAQAGGVLTGVKGLVGRAAIGIDDVAMYRCTDDSGIG